MDTLQLIAAEDCMAGGAAIADLDGDGVPELIVANGQVAVLRWISAGYDEPRILSISDAIGVTSTDVDRDGLVDLLIATAGDTDHVRWGGAWLDTNAEPDQLDLASPGQSRLARQPIER